jgi:hypothetical protein
VRRGAKEEEMPSRKSEFKVQGARDPADPPVHARRSNSGKQSTLAGTVKRRAAALTLTKLAMPDRR